MDIVLVTTGTRFDLLTQTLKSLRANSVRWEQHTLTVVIDGSGMAHSAGDFKDSMTVIYSPKKPGASACRNIGASSIPKYRRQEHVMFIDDDVYMCLKWDMRLLELARLLPDSIISGHAHPFNHAEPHCITSASSIRIRDPILYAEPLVISSVHMLMPWPLWDDVGYFIEPGGPGGSEDVEWCARAVKKGYGLAITDPMCVAHCGLTSSSGQKIVGYGLMIEMNQKLVAQYGLTGKVHFG